MIGIDTSFDYRSDGRGLRQKIADHDAVRFLLPFDDFTTSAVPADVETHVEFRQRSVEFIDARNQRITRASGTRASLQERERAY